MNKTKILIIDDNQEFLDLLCEFISASNYITNCCNDSKDALQKFDDFNPDIVITDIIMPNIDGIEVLITLRKKNPSTKFIVISGGNKGHGESYLRMAKELGANIILNKPFELTVLLKKIKSIE